MLDIGVPEHLLGIIMGNGKLYVRGRLINATRRDAPIQIASIDTLRHRYLPDADIVFRDEAHRCLSKSDLALKAKYPNAVHVGLTASPQRYGGKGLGPYYASMVIGATPSMLIEKGFILKPRIWTVPPEQLPDLSGVKIKNGDYSDSDLAEVCNKRELVGSIVEHWKRHAGGRRTIGFAVNVAHSQSIVADFVAGGVAAEHLDGSMSSEERNAILQRLERGETLVVVSCGVLIEGIDIPSVKCAILARPTKSIVIFLQSIGRILRPWEGIDAIVLDHAGCVMEHGLPSDDREWSLQDTKIKRKGMSTKTCLSCFAVVETTHKECPVCGTPFPIAAREGGGASFVQVEGTLVEYGTDAQEKERRDYWAHLCKLSKENNYQQGWAKHRFKDKFGHWPPKSYGQGIGRPMTQGELDVMRARLMRLAGERGYGTSWVERKMAEQAELVVSLAAEQARPVLSAPEPTSSPVKPALTLVPPPKSAIDAPPLTPAKRQADLFLVPALPTATVAATKGEPEEKAEPEKKLTMLVESEVERWHL
jgi:DNA repair protein RadD